MFGPIEDAYFIWLSNQINYVEIPTPSLTYKQLLRTMHSTEFVWCVHGDDNRAAKGLELREQFISEVDHLDDENFDISGASVLEVLIALAIDIEFQMDEPYDDWFWTMVDNLGLADLNDANYVEGVTEDVLDIWMWRLYTENGYGGIFPLHDWSEDQREVELWYQFMAYLDDNEL